MEKTHDFGGLPRHYSLEQCSSYLDVSLRTVKRLVRSGELASIVVGKRNRRVTADQLRAYIEQQEGGAWPDQNPKTESERASSLHVRRMRTTDCAGTTQQSAKRAMYALTQQLIARPKKSCR